MLSSIESAGPQSDSLELARSLAESLAPGRHELSRGLLDRVYGLAPMTAGVRTRIASELDYVGLVVLSDPCNEPLVVAKPPDVSAGIRGADDPD